MEVIATVTCAALVVAAIDSMEIVVGLHPTVVGIALEEEEGEGLCTTSEEVVERGAIATTLGKKC
jgi:hypothetical protein